MTAHLALHELIQRSSGSGGPALLGLVGPPGAGKSYAACRVAETLTTAGVCAAVLPMDGFHLSNRQLEDLGRGSRKGAPDTFDVAGLVALLRRVAEDPGEPVYCPDYDRELHEPVAARIRIGSGTRVVVVEGNYLLLDDGPWAGVREWLDAIWYLDAPAQLREQRLVDRHIAGGQSEAGAKEWAQRVDGANAELIAATRSSADLVIDSRELAEQLEQFRRRAPGL